MCAHTRGSYGTDPVSHHPAPRAPRCDKHGVCTLDSQPLTPSSQLMESPTGLITRPSLTAAAMPCAAHCEKANLHHGSPRPRGRPPLRRAPRGSPKALGSLREWGARALPTLRCPGGGAPRGCLLLGEACGSELVLSLGPGEGSPCRALRVPSGRARPHRARGSVGPGGPPPLLPDHSLGFWDLSPT